MENCSNIIRPIVLGGSGCWAYISRDMDANYSLIMWTRQFSLVI